MFGTVYKGLTKEGEWIYFKVPYGKTCRNLKTASKYANADIVEFGLAYFYNSSILHMLYVFLFK